MFGFFEVGGNAVKRRVMADKSFATIEDAVAHFGDKVGCCDIEPDGSAADIFVTIGMGSVYAIEKVSQ
jgi:hypothetical protein